MAIPRNPPVRLIEWPRLMLLLGVYMCSSLRTPPSHSNGVPAFSSDARKGKQAHLDHDFAAKNFLGLAMG